MTSAFTPHPRDRGRADACPGALRPHSADDGALFRVRLPGGLLTPDQMTELASICEELGDGHLDLTSRGNLQLRGLADDAGGPLAQRLADCGLLPSPRHERARNVVASPLCGVDGRGHADVRGWARELDALLCASDPAAELSGRFLFALDDGRGDVAALGADVTLVARADGLAELRLGGAGAPAALVPGRDAARWAVRAAEEFVTLAARSAGRVWRIADVDPDGGALRARLGPTGRDHVTADASGRAEGVAAGGVPLGIVGLGVSVAAPLGRVSAARWREVAAVAAGGCGEVRVTPWRGVVVPGARPGWAAAALERLRAAGFVTDSASAWSAASACAGRPGCAKSLADVRADAAVTLSAGPERPGAAALPVHWSGCERRCGRPSGDDWLDVLAVPDGYRVTLRGVTRDVTREQAPAVIPAARQTTSARDT